MPYVFNPFTGNFDYTSSGGGGGANTSLSNLTSTSINQPLQAQTDLSLLAGPAPGSGPGYNVNITSSDSNDDAPGYINLTIGTGSIGGGGIRMSTFSGGAGTAGDLWTNIGDSGSGQWKTALLASQQYSAAAVSITNVNVSSPGSPVYDGVDITGGILYVLLTNQSDPIENGLWYYDGLQLNRPTAWSNGQSIPPGAKVTVAAGGTKYGNTTWIANTNTTTNVIVGTDQLPVSPYGFNPATFAFNLVPVADYNYNLGSSSNAFDTLFTHNITSTTDLNIVGGAVVIRGETTALNITTSGASSQTINVGSGSSLGAGESSGDVNITTGDADLNTGDIYLTTGTPNTGLQGRILTTARSMLLPQGSSDPAGVSSGEVYYNTTINKIKVFNGTTWETVTSI